MAESPPEASKPGPSLLSGQEAIDHLLRPGNSFLPLQDETSLLEFLQSSLPHWINEASFACKNRIRDIEIANADELKVAAKGKRDAQMAYDKCDAKAEIERRKGELQSARLECEGRRAFLSKLQLPSSEGGSGGESEEEEGKDGRGGKGKKGGRAVVTKEKVAEVEEVLREKEGGIEALQTRYDALTLSTPEWVALEGAIAEEEALKARVGLYAQRETLAKADKQMGRGKSSGGSNFEEDVRKIIYDRIIPALQRGGRAEPDGGEIVAVRSVSLGIARGEIDFLIVQKPKPTASDAEPGAATGKEGGKEEGGEAWKGAVVGVGGHRQPTGRGKEKPTDNAQPVVVLGAVEVKQNPNDVGAVFHKYVERLAWMMGDARGYEASAMKTKFYPQGHFNKPFLHKDGVSGETLLFDTSSFRLFAQEAAEEGLERAVLQRLHFVTRSRLLHGMSSGVLRKLQNDVGSKWEARLKCAELAGEEEGKGRMTAALEEPAKAANALLESVSAVSEASLLTTHALCRKYEELPAPLRNLHLVVLPTRTSSPTPDSEPASEPAPSSQSQ